MKCKNCESLKISVEIASEKYLHAISRLTLVEKELAALYKERRKNPKTETKNTDRD